MVVHAARQAPLDILGKRVGGHGDDGELRIRPSEFHVVLDLKRAAAPAVSEAPDGTGGAGDVVLKGKRVLLAEDNELNWEVTRELLSGLQGHRPIPCFHYPPDIVYFRYFFNLQATV